MAEQVSKRSVVYEILVDFQQGKKSVQDAEKAIEEFSREVNGAATGVEKFAKSTEASVGRLRQLKTQLNNFKGSQKEFEALSLEAARLQDQLDKTNRRIRTLASSTRQIEALASGVQGLVGVFTAVQGAAALFGQENKDLQKSILRVQGALALLQGVQQAVATVTEQSALKTVLYSNAIKVYEFVTKGATVATRLFNAAMVATIGGAIIAGITLLIAKWDDLKVALGFANDEQEKLNESTKEFIAITKDAESQLSISERSISSIRKEIDELKKSLENRPKTNLKIGYAWSGDEVSDKTESFDSFSDRLTKRIEELQAELDKRENKVKIKIQIGGEREVLQPQDAEGIASESAFFAEQERLAREKAENEKQGFIVKTAEVQQTAHEMLKQQMEAEIAMYEARNQVLLAAGSIFGSLLQLQVGGSKAQLALAIAEILTNQAVAISKAISSAKGVTAFDYAAQVATAVATAIGTFAQINAVISQAKAAQSAAASQAATQAEGFAEGTPYLDDASAPHGRDTIPIWADRGEAIIPTRKNMEEPGLAAAWINGSLDEYIGINYVAPALAAKTIEEIKHDSTIDYSTRFYKQLLVTAEGNAINKKALTYLSSINDRLNRTIPSRYA